MDSAVSVVTLATAAAVTGWPMNRGWRSSVANEAALFSYCSCLVLFLAWDATVTTNTATMLTTNCSMKVQFVIFLHYIWEQNGKVKLTTLKTATKYFGFLVVTGVGFTVFSTVLVMVLLSDVEWLVGNIVRCGYRWTYVPFFIAKEQWVIRILARIRKKSADYDSNGRKSQSPQCGLLFSKCKINLRPGTTLPSNESRESTRECTSHAMGIDN